MAVNKLEHLQNLLRSYGSCLVAYSGGVDSAFLAYVAHEVLGDKSLAVLADSPSLPRRELEEAVAVARQFAIPLRIVGTVAAVNEQRKRAMARKVVTALGGSVRGKTIAVLGLTFKPNTDDTRDSPAIPLITALHDLGATVRGYDPAGMEQAKPQLPSVVYCTSAYSAAEDADAVVIATEWEQFRALDLQRLKDIMAHPVIVDLRNIYRTDEMKRANFRYVAIGRPGVD